MKYRNISLFLVNRLQRSSLQLLLSMVLWSWAISLRAQQEVAGFEIRRIGVQNGLMNQTITALTRDENNTLWIGTFTGLYRMDGLGVLQIDTQFVMDNRKAIKCITDLNYDNGPRPLIFVCSKLDAFIIDPLTSKKIPPHQIGIPDSLFKGFIQIERGGEDFFFGLCNQQIYKISRISPGNYTCKPWYQVPVTFPPLNMVADPANPEAVWLLLSIGQVWHASPQGVLKYILTENPQKQTEPSGLQQMIYTPKGVFGWDLDRHIYKLEEPSRQFIRMPDSMGLSDLVPNISAVDIAMRQKESLRCFLPLDINQVALGTTLGLFIVRKKTTGFHSIDALREEEIRGIYADSTGRWAVGTYFGLVTGHLGEKKIKKHPNVRTVWDFLAINGRRHFMGLETANGVMFWDPVSDKIIDSTQIKKNPNFIQWNQVLSIRKDVFGFTWLGGEYNLWWSHPDNPFHFQPYQDPTTGQPFPHTNIRAVLPARDSSLWFGTEDGLYCMRYSPTFNQYLYKKPDSFTGKYPVSDIYEDRTGNLWVGTKGRGLARISPGNTRIDWFSTDAGLCDSMICRIESSHHDSVFWISTHNGLSRFTVHTGAFHNFFEENGFPGNEFNSAASAQFPDGTMLFGGVNGLIYFHPDSIYAPPYEYNISVPYAQVYKDGVGSMIALKQFPEGLRTDAYPELIEFILGTNEYIRPDKIRYRYRLLGLSDKWYHINGENKVQYIHLSPGHYTFEVQAIPLDGHFGSIISIPVFVETPYNETWWFRSFILGIIILIAYAAYRYRLRQIMKEQLIRQQVADDLHDDIGNKLNIIGIVAQKVSSFLKKNKAPLPNDDSLDKLLELSRDTQISLITMIWAVDPSKDRLINLIIRMQDFADDFVRPLVHQFQFNAPEEFPDRDLNLRVRHHLLLIYQELLVNMIKHTHSVRITADVQLEGDKMIVMLINQHRPDMDKPFDTISSNRGQSTLNRRIKDINGLIRYEKTGASIQITTLVVPQIFKKT